MKAFTVTTRHPEWQELTRECVRRLRHYAGITCEVITARDQYDSHVIKLTHPLSCREPLWFFDSDWWLIHPASLPPIPTGGITAVHCRSGFERYQTTSLTPQQIFGTTLYGADMSSPAVRSVFQHARTLQQTHFSNDRPRMDECFLNIAAHHAGLPLTLIGYEWNHCSHPQPDTLALHAASMWPKLPWLREKTPALTPTSPALHPLHRRLPRPAHTPAPVPAPIATTPSTASAAAPTSP